MLSRMPIVGSGESGGSKQERKYKPYGFATPFRPSRPFTISDIGEYLAVYILKSNVGTASINPKTSDITIEEIDKINPTSSSTMYTFKITTTSENQIIEGNFGSDNTEMVILKVE